MKHKQTILHSFAEEGDDLLRGAAGGLIFGTPLLFTLEMWLHGMRIAPAHLLLFLLFITLINIGFSYSSGLREHNEGHSILGAVADAITAMVIGLMVAIIILSLIGQFNNGDGFDILLGKTIIEAGAISLGVTFTNTKFPRKKGRDRKEKSNYESLEKSPLSAEQKQARLDFQNMAAVIGGAVIFSFNVAPTEEIMIIASKQTPTTLLLMLASQLLICYIILYAADFKEHKVFKKTPMQSPVAEIIITAALSLVVAAVMLSLMGYGHAFNSLYVFISSVIILGLPAIIGGAAGKAIV